MATKKTINLALQGGGSHGAFAWGVLDRLLEDERIGIEGVVGTSAGAMNAAVLAYGLSIGGNAGARERLREFWTRVGQVAATSPLQPSWLDRATSPGSMDQSPMWLWFDAMTRFLSPYQFNPLNNHPLRDVLLEVVDFERLRRESTVKLFTCAANVLTGRIRVFECREMCIEAVLASACLPFMFQAVEVAGERNGVKVEGFAALPTLTRANALRQRAEFYNSLTANCTSTIVRHVSSLVPGRVPFSYRWLLPGYADRLAYDLGLIDTDVAYDSLRVRFRITDAARAVGDGAGFSARIRAGLMR